MAAGIAIMLQGAALPKRAVYLMDDFMNRLMNRLVKHGEAHGCT